MQPLPLTRFWHHRICEAIMLVSGLVLALYFWAFFADVEQLSGALLVHDFAAIAAGVAFFGAAISYMWAPRRYIFATSLAGYYVLVAMVALLLSDTGYLGSPFVALYMLLGVFAAVFGIYGMAVIVAGGAGFLAWQLAQGLFAWSDVAAVLLLGVLPVAIGYVVWHRATNPEQTSEDRAYHELASELSTLSGQSEVVIAAITDGLVSLDAKGTIQLINPAAAQMIGWQAADAKQLDYGAVLKLVDNHDQPVSAHNDPIRQALDTNQRHQSDVLSLTTSDSGNSFQASITASPVGSSGSGVIVVFRDITKERAEEREQAEFISTASHEMRTPVASIEGYLGLALNPATAQIDEKAREFITKAHESAQHLGRLFQDLLDVTKADDGRLSNNPRVVDMVPFVHDIIEGQLPKATEKGLIVTYKPQPDLYDDPNDERGRGDRTISPVFYVNVDNDHLREVAGNLIENAIKYTPHGSVTVDITGTDQHVTLSVTDSGIGIPAEDIPHLFQKFYRVDNTDTREIGGTGLGLYLCRRLTEAMGGQIWVESQYQQGSTFFVKLPRMDHSEAQRQIEAAGDEPAPASTQAADVAAQLVAQDLGMPLPTTPNPLPAQVPVMSSPATVMPPTPPTAPMPSSPAPTAGPVQRPSIEQMSPLAQPQAATPTNVTAAPISLTVPARPNTPLSNIEANPRAYLGRVEQNKPSQPPS